MGLGAGDITDQSEWDLAYEEDSGCEITRVLGLVSRAVCCQMTCLRSLTFKVDFYTRSQGE